MSSSSFAPHGDAIETAVVALGCELVDVERGPGGLLRVTIDRPTADGASVTVDDCERVTRQLQHVLPVEGIAYERLEVSSPGLDRPLRRAADFERFAGEQIELVLKAPLEGRKRYRGELQRRGDDGWRVIFDRDGKAAADARTTRGRRAGGQARARGAAAAADPASLMTLDFTLDEVREARLVPQLDFKGRSNARHGEVPASPHDKIAGGPSP